MVVGDQQVGHREQGRVPGFHADDEVGEENVHRTVKISHMIPSERQKTSLLT